MHLPITCLKRRWRAALLFTLCLLAFPYDMAASGFVEGTYNYMAYLSGTDQITIKVPVFDKDGYDTWVRNGRLYCKADGFEEKVVLFWGVNDGETEVGDNDPAEYGNNKKDWDVPHSQYWVWTHLATYINGSVFCKIESDYHEKTLTQGSVIREKVYTGNGNDHITLNARWVVPDELRGKKLEFRWQVQRSGHGRSKMKVDGIEPFTIDMPAAPTALDINVSRPILHNDYPGKLVVPWIIGTNKVKKVQAEYFDRNNKKIVELIPDTIPQGMIPVDATEPHRSFYLKVDYYNSENKLVTDRMSEPVNLPMIHKPLAFSAIPDSKGSGSVFLTWGTDCMVDEDLFEGDVYEIERSMTGKEEDYANIGYEVYDNNTSSYTFKDSTLVPSLSQDLVNEQGVFPNITYRIRRGSTSMWGWSDNPTVSKTSFQVGEIRLLHPIDIKSEWKDEKSRTVKVAWDYKQGTSSRWYVWDKRANMCIKVRMYNRNNQLVDTMVYTLTAQEIAEKTKILTFSRPCIKYEIEMEVSSNTFPTNKSNNKVVIRSKDDWNDLVDMVEKGTYSNYHVIFETDLNLTPYDKILGSDKPFSGIIEGNGHTIKTYDIVPFPKMENAFVNSLRFEPTNSGEERFLCCPLVGDATYTVFRNCVAESYMNLTNMGLGAAFVKTGEKVTFMDCMSTLKSFRKVYDHNPLIWAGFIHKATDCSFSNSLTFIENSPDIAKSSNNNIFDYYVEGAATLNNCFFYGFKHDQTHVLSEMLTQSQLDGDEALALLGDQWERSSERPGITPIFSILTEDDFTPGTFVGKASEPSDMFYYEVSGRVGKELDLMTRQSSVVLSWDIVDGVVDYCEVRRREVGKGDFETIGPNITDNVYEDRKVQPTKKYEYTVRSAVSCEGIQYHYTDTIIGGCKDTGLVEGSVCFADGTGIPGLTVTIIDPNNKTVGVQTTDDKGRFSFEDLSYLGQLSVTYMLYITSNDGLEFQSGDGSFPVTFNEDHNYREYNNIVVTSGYLFSGYVMYAGTSIPVPGVNFSVNDHVMHTGNGKMLETDNNGKFSFYVLGDKQLNIRAWKEGHIFANGGLYTHTFNSKLSGVYFYDDTKVKLIGRVAGGHIQGELPLGNSLSRNNLGSELCMVLTLEGDNTSQLVYDNNNPLLTERDTMFVNPSLSKKKEHQTIVKTYRKRMVVTPDQTTGEYNIMLPPVKWKIQQVYCEGYPTLFQEGKVSDVVDLTDSLTLHTDTYEGAWTDIDSLTVTHPKVEYNGRYNCIYHAPVELVYTQSNYDTFEYFGDKSYTAYNDCGDREIVPLAYPEETNKGRGVPKAKYTFGHPVFNINRPYYFKLSAQERYYWKNNQRSDTIDVVSLNGGKVTVRNSMESTTHKEVVELDSMGIGYITLRAAEISYNLTDEDALRTVTWTLDYQGGSFEAEPLDAYILNVYAIPGANDILNTEMPQLVDILRDPPGGGSNATLSKGSTLKYSYSMDMKWSAGMSLKISEGSGMKNYYGVTTTSAPGAVGPSYGIIQDAQTSLEYATDFTFSGSGNRSYNYTITATEDIKTSSAAGMVGADADLYIGVVQNNIVKPAVAIRAVSDSVFQQMVGQLSGGVLPTGKKAKTGSMCEIANGTAANGKKYHLVRNETMSLGAEITSTFIHSQKYILTQLIPDLFIKCRSLMFVGTPEEAQDKADATHLPVYLSLVEVNDSAFALMNMANGKPVYYTLEDHQSAATRLDSMNYCIVLPTGYKKTGTEVDEVQKYCGIMYEWIKMVERNEEEKLLATDLVRNFDIDGGSSTTYTENFESQYANTWSWSLPAGLSKDSYFSDSELGAQTGEYLLNLGNAFGKTLGSFVLKLITKAIAKKNDNVKAEGGKDSGNSVFTTQVNFTGSRFLFILYPTMSYSVTPKNTKTQTYNRKESFTISMNNVSHLDFDVYRASTVIGVKKDENNNTGGNNDVMDVFSSDNFYTLTDSNYEFLDRHFDFDNAKNDFYRSARGFVYRTRGGATALPWEDQRKTIFAQPGTELDARTKKIQNPKIWLDQQSLSGVPYGEPARFKLYLTNDSEEPNASSNAVSSFTLLFDDSSNPNGAKVFIDGSPLIGEGRSIFLPPGTVVEKTMEVYAGQDFDYENLKLTVATSVFEITASVNFDVHFLHTAGPVNISTPSDKWVMNTDAPFNKKGYYLPVVIDGFDRKQKNFDHIEFQYKETARGDDYWINLCSYYDKDSLMALASGTKEMIPENGFIKTAFYGEGIVAEKAYDLRAVLFIRSGSSFITSSSKIISGIKDTRRPMVFGSPQPSDGILDIGENIIFDFTEGIEYNFLDPKVCFEVKGETNNNNISEDVALLFNGNGSVETEVERNFSGKDITISMMVKPDMNNDEMPLFSHGTDNKKLQLWLTKDLKIKAVVNNNNSKDDVFVSNEPIDPTAYQQVAMVIRQPENVQSPSTLHLVYGGKGVGDFELSEPYTGTGKLIFGRTNELYDNENTRHYKGRMMEARLWYRALNAGLLGTSYGKKRLTGYEMGLVDYYPMNDGDGDYAVDKALGAHAKLINVSWAKPRGMSLHLDWEDRGIALKEKALLRSAEEDYTLMFWFKTDGTDHGTLISNGAGYSDDIGAENQFFIGFEGQRLHYRSNGMDIDVPGDYNDSQWHHFAMTVNRSHHLANIYMDRTLRSTFSADSLGGISGGYPRIGGTLHQSKKDNLVEDTHNWLRGNIDDICMFEQAMPLSLIKSYSLKSPFGDEAGLMTYLGFSRQERDSNNVIVLHPYAYSQVLHKDKDGNILCQLDSLTQQSTGIPVRDYLFDVPEKQVLDHVDQNDAAPVKPYEELSNLNFNFVGRDNQLLVSIEEPTDYINKRNIYVTVRNIPDLNGNYMASPATINCYVDRNPLRWNEKTVRREVIYGEEAEISLLIKNLSGVEHTYKVENCPRWLTPSPRTGVLGAKDETYIDFAINKNLNVGRYDEIIYLTDENGLTDQLSLSITIVGETPQWTVNNSLRNHSMNIVGRVVIGNEQNYEIDCDRHDVVGCFDQDGNCHGVASITFDEETGKSLVYMTIYNDSVNSGPLYFKLWHNATGREMLLVNYDNITFQQSKVYGRSDNPCIFYANNQYVQEIALEKGWNWVSFNVWSTRFYDIDGLLSHFPWQNGDIITDNNNNITLIYKNNKWIISDSLKNVQIYPRYSYALRVSKDIDIQVAGFIMKDKADRGIIVKNGWNSIGYTPMINLPVETALADYFAYAEDGDVIKSHDEFAIFYKSGETGRWEGSLQYMKPGEGYMLMHQGEKTVRFYYPYFEPGTTFIEAARMPARNNASSEYANNMSLSAIATGLKLEDGDRLLAFADGELRGAATMTTDSLFYMSIAGDRQEHLSFAIEREGEIIAKTPELLTYQSNAVMGKPGAPTRINFTHVELPQHGWYTLDGIKLNSRPTKKGVYIYNGKKRVIDN